MMKSGLGPTVSVKVVGVVVLPRGLPLTCTTYEPVGVEEVEERIRVLDPVGVMFSGLNEQEASVGRLDLTQDNVMEVDVPFFNVAVTVFVPDSPCCKVTPPEFDNE